MRNAVPRWRTAAPRLLAVVLTCAACVEQPRAGAEIDDASSEPDRGERYALRLQLVDLSGDEVTYEFLGSDTVVYASIWGQRAFRLEPGDVRRLRDQLLQDGACSMQPSEHVPTGRSKQRIVLAVENGATPCWVDLPTEEWSARGPARRLLDAIRAVLGPVRDQCPDCQQP